MISSHKGLIPQVIDDTICVLFLNRPDAANALSCDMALEIKDFFARLPETDCRAVILAGKGKHFCAGADIKERSGISDEEWLRQHHVLEGAMLAILNCPIPVIAAVEGAAMGGGLELALACDFIYASETARFGLTETTLGIMPGLGGTQTLQRAIGMRRAKELTLLGKKFSAVDAYRYGMINQLCSPHTLMDDAINCAIAISKNAPLSVRAIKQAVNEGAGLSLHDALHCELKHYATLLPTADRREGTNAFNEKRTPVFKGE